MVFIVSAELTLHQSFLMDKLCSQRVIIYSGDLSDLDFGRLTIKIQTGEPFMRNSVRYALFVTLVCSSACIGLFGRPAADDSAMRQADHDFVLAVTKSDQPALGKLLDKNFMWIDSNGKALAKTQVLQAVPMPGIADEAGAELKHYIYEDVGDVQANLGRVHTLRVWVKRPAGWRIIVYQEVTSLIASPSFAPGAGKDCQNPCKSVGYEPKNDAEKQVVSAYQRLETAAMAHDSGHFSTLVGDEFAAASSNSNKVYDKRGRMDDFDHSKMAGVAPTPLESARMFDFNGAVVMTSIHRPDRGKPLRVTRLWVSRDGRWQETLSYQTSVTP